MYFRRSLQDQIEADLSGGRAIIIYGARQVGKTTLIKKIIADFKGKSLYLNCDEPDIRALLSGKTSTELGQLIGDTALIAIDEAQRVRNIGLTLKLMIDNFPRTQIIATGSSSFELSNSVKEPLTGRKFEFQLFPLAIGELTQAYSDVEIKRLLEDILRYGLYPETVTSATNRKSQVIKEIADSYLYRDVLEYQNLKKPELLEKLLQAIALQLGNEVSYRELAVLTGVDKQTVEKYINLLEQAFIIFRLPAFSRNLRQEIARKRKIYFFDTGIRNSVIRNFNPLNLRNDVGCLWENFLIVERIKSRAIQDIDVKQYFWRTYDRKEIDFLEEKEGKLTGYEFKWRKGKIKRHKDFLGAYPGSSIHLINRDNFLEFVR